MLKARSPLSGNQIHLPKSGRKPLQPKNSPANPIIPHQKAKPTKQNAATGEWIEILMVDENSNKENMHPLFATPVKYDSFKVDQLDSSLAEELSAIREKLERMSIDKEKTEKMLGERELLLDMQMKELEMRGEAQKTLEIEVDRLYRLKQLKLSCMRISPIRSLREKGKKRERKIKEDGLQFQERKTFEGNEINDGESLST